VCAIEIDHCCFWLVTVLYRCHYFVVGFLNLNVCSLVMFLCAYCTVLSFDDYNNDANKDD
jgi:hypothetical protein